MATPDDELQAMLAELKQQFLQRAGEQAASIVAACASLDPALPCGNQPAATELIRLWHRIAGSAGSFGLDDLSVSARAHERWLEADVTDAGIMPAERADRISAMSALAARLG